MQSTYWDRWVMSADMKQHHRELDPGFFTKIDCFCFEEQILMPGERVQMPVSFYVDPEIVDDSEGKYIHTITLSYTFYEIDLPEQQAALQVATNINRN